MTTTATGFARLSLQGHDLLLPQQQVVALLLATQDAADSWPIIHHDGVDYMPKIMPEGLSAAVDHANYRLLLTVDDTYFYINIEELLLLPATTTIEPQTLPPCMQSTATAFIHQLALHQGNLLLLTTAKSLLQICSTPEIRP